ncbi:hypothetical protein [Brasilonema octagenarum]|uniref:hypothetical protein n=1 Tax=Brasilonema octagenarum TaxID=417105 RepID=UPI00145E3A9A|nr:hypothetical protein [Brasilonema octagenarum]
MKVSRGGAWVAGEEKELMSINSSPPAPLLPLLKNSLPQQITFLTQAYCPITNSTIVGAVKEYHDLRL